MCKAKINAAAGWIPVGQLPSPPTYHLVNPADTPVLILALTSDTLPLHEVNDYAVTVIVPKLSQISGVGAVAVEGGQTRAVRLQVNPSRLAGLGMSLDDVRRGIAATTADNPKGSLDGPRQAFQVDANDQLFTADAYQDAVIAYRNGAPVLLRDVGKRDRQRRGFRTGGLVSGHAGGAARYPAPARRQHHQGGRSGQGGAAEAAGVAAAVAARSPWSPIAPRRSAPPSPTSSSRWS